MNSVSLIIWWTCSSNSIQTNHWTIEKIQRVEIAKRPWNVCVFLHLVKESPIWQLWKLVFLLAHLFVFLLLSLCQVSFFHLGKMNSILVNLIFSHLSLKYRPGKQLENYCTIVSWTYANRPVLLFYGPQCSGEWEISGVRVTFDFQKWFSCGVGMAQVRRESCSHFWVGSAPPLDRTTSTRTCFCSGCSLDPFNLSLSL